VRHFAVGEWTWPHLVRGGPGALSCWPRSLAIDLGPGQPLEHMLRSCLIAMTIAALVGADAL
jgi:hypothetical protein